LCDIYNVANDPHVCAMLSPPSSGGCSCDVAWGGARSTVGLAGGAALLALAAALRRRGRRARS
jgi:hypothetical protein